MTDDEPTDEPTEDAAVAPTDDPDQPAAIDEALEAATDIKAKKKGKKKKTKIVVQQVTPTWVRWAAVATAIVVVALALVAVQQARHADDVSARSHDRTSAERVAGEFAQLLFSNDPAHPTASLDRLKVLATAKYAPQVDQARQSASADKTATDQRTATSATVTDVFLAEIDGSQAQAVTRIAVVLSAGGKSVALDGYVHVDLKKEGGTWKIDGANGISLGAAQGTSSAPTPTVTTAPAAASSTTSTAPR